MLIHNKDDIEFVTEFPCFKILKLIYFYLFNIFSYYNYIYHMEFQKINFKKGTTIRQLITNKLGEITIISEIDS